MEKNVKNISNLEIAQKMVMITAHEFGIPFPEVYFTSRENLGNVEITGVFDFVDYQVIFNEDWVNERPWIEVVITSVHETRHAYQQYCVKNQKHEPPETLDNWYNDINNYLLPTEDNNEFSDQDYLNQSIELDAIAYTHYKIKKIFNVSTVIPSTIKDKVMALIETYD